MKVTPKRRTKERENNYSTQRDRMITKKKIPRYHHHYYRRRRLTRFQTPMKKMSVTKPGRPSKWDPIKTRNKGPLRFRATLFYKRCLHSTPPSPFPLSSGQHLPSHQRRCILPGRAITSCYLPLSSHTLHPNPKPRSSIFSPLFFVVFVPSFSRSGLQQRSAVE